MSKLVKEKECWLVKLTDYDDDIWYSDIEACSKEEAIKLGMEYAKKEGLNSFYIGRKEQCGVPVISVDNIIENALNQLYDEVGNISEFYLEGVSKEQEDELEDKLNEVFFEWHKKYNLFPSFYTVEDEEKIEVE